MRQIKFRAWTKGHRGRMAYADWENFRHEIGEWIGNEERGVVLEQFTGLLDKNGKEIYEGDIVAVWEKVLEDDVADKKPYLVKYFADDSSYPAFDLEGRDSEMNSFSEILEGGEYEMEVIGNIHENPELIKT